MAFPFGQRIAEIWTALTPWNRGSPSDDSEGPLLDGMVSRPGDVVILGQNLDAYTNAILASNPDTILRREGGQDLELFDALLDDDVAFSNLQTRRLSITSKDWEVAPGDEDDPRSVQAADDLRAMLKGLGWDRVTGLMHFAVWYGYAVAEAMWTTKVHDGRRIIWLDDVVVPDRRYFGFTISGELRFTGVLTSIGGEALPNNKFWALRTGGTHDFAFYGLGLAHWCYWPIWFKRAANRFWALYLEKMSNPTAVGEKGDGWEEDDKKGFLKALVDIGRVSAVAVPQGALEKIKLMESARSSAGVSGYRDFVKEQNESLMRVVLGQPGSSSAQPQGIGGGQADAHKEVEHTLVKADSDLICEGFNGSFARLVTLWNHGPDVAPPRVYRILDDAEDANTTAERDVKLDGIGIRRTKESVAEVYGEGYELVERPTPAETFAAQREDAKAKLLGGPAGPGGKPGKAANDTAPDPRDARAAKARQFDAHDPEPLYVGRDLLNRDALASWAKGQGLTLVDDPHVTVLYSRTPVDWFKMGGNDWGEPSGAMTVPAGGPRKIERLGQDGEAIVLQFYSSDIRWRHETMIERGASHDFDTFEPHVTLQIDPDKAIDIEAIEPYDGPLEFGPELFRPIEGEDPADPSSYAFEAAELDAIDRLARRIASDSDPVFAAMADTLQANLEGVTTLEGARVALLQAFEAMDWRALARLTALPLLAERAAAEAGVEERVEA